MKSSRWMVVALFMLLPAGHAVWASPQDAYIAGYAAAELQYADHVTAADIKVRDGIIYVSLPPHIAGVNRQAIARQLSRIKGVRKVIFAAPAAQSPAAPAIVTPPTTSSTTAPTPIGMAPSVPASVPIPKQLRQSPWAFGFNVLHRRHLYRMPTGFLPPGQLFTPLLADPKWPGFSAAYANYAPYHPANLNAVVQVAIGGTVPLYRGNLGRHWQWETGMFGTDYAYFNTNAPNVDLQNNDYQVGGYFAFRHRNWSFYTRFFHQSSHLGDGYIANILGGTQGISVFTYEQLGGYVSYSFYHRWFRLYAGAGYFFDTYPYDLGKEIFQYGAEFHGPAFARFHSLYVSPVAGIDLKNWAQTHYSTDISARAGFQFDNGSISSPTMQILFEYYHGHSPFGEFYNNVIQYVGIGLHVQY